MRRPPTNLTSNERVARIGVGLVGIIVGVVLLTSADGALAILLEALLALAGVDLAVTGVLGHCPLYKRLGYTPQSLRKPT